MIINKLEPYWTEEDLEKLHRFNLSQGELLDALEIIKEDELADGGKVTTYRGKVTTYKNENFVLNWGKLDEEIKEIHRAVEDRYIKSFARNKNGILADIKNIVNNIELKDFEEEIDKTLNQLILFRKQGIAEETLAPFKEHATANYTNCYEFILSKLRVQFEALAYYNMDSYKAEALIDKRVSLWYVKPQPAYLPTVHGKATDALAYMSNKRAKIDQITKDVTIEKMGVQLIISAPKKLKASWKVSTDKLFSTALATFTKNNDFTHLKGKEPEREITIGLREYAQSLGYDIEEHTTHTPEEAKKEKKRVKNQLDNIRKAVKEDLDIIHDSRISWEDPIKVKGKPSDFKRISLVTLTGIENGEILISLSPEIAGYLAERNLITQYPTKLLKLDSRKPNAYYIGRKLTGYYNIDNNQMRGTQNRISIKKLLEVTDLPTYEEVQKKDRGHWANRIKEPFEEALDELTRNHILKNWEYIHAKGVPLTDEEAEDITTYQDFASLYLLFDPADKVDHEERIEAKQEERRTQRARSKRTKKSTVK